MHSYKIKNLKDTELTTIVDCLVKAFANYFVPMPDSVDYWRNRFQAARVDFELSYGVFDKDQLVAFIINGIDGEEEALTAFNTGTGVLPAYRGQQLVDQLYEKAIPIFKDHKITKCALEVIQANDRAIRVYERIGFTKQRSLQCFKGTIAMELEEVKIMSIDFSFMAAPTNSSHYSWDNSNEAVLSAGKQYTTYAVLKKNKESIGYFTINESGYVPQLESRAADFPYLMSGIQQVAPTIKINNVDARRTDFIANLLAAGLENTVDQFEMEMAI